MSKGSRTGARAGTAGAEPDAAAPAKKTRAQRPAKRAPPPAPPPGGGAPPEEVASPPIVGMVASAGGLEAYRAFFQAMPAHSGLAFVLVPHLDPRRESLMPQLIGKYTSMPVSEAVQGVRIEADHVYVVPPNRYLLLEHGTVRLAGPVEGSQTSIDVSLRSLADDQQERAICVVLSGTGPHGALGLRAIKAAGGVALVQDPRTAEFERMPQSAVSTGLADAVLPVEKMPEALIRYARLLHSTTHTASEGSRMPDELAQVIALLRARAKTDFRCYRKAMVLRRVHRRMGLLRVDTLADYIALMRERPDEVKALSRDLLISVTSFFRDAEAYKFLEAQAIPELLRRKAPEAPVRVWVPGCATGEEAYSLAMLLLEQMSAAQMSNPLQIFASDIDVDALEVARAGLYASALTADLPHERLNRFFVRVDDDNYQVSKALREAVLFTSQNVLADAPFSRLDLVSCRNLLIYLEPEVQDKVLALLHFALVDGGVLMLGPSESIGRHGAHFSPLSKTWRIYRRSGPNRPERVDLPIAQPAAAAHGREATQPARTSFAELTRDLLITYFAPAAVLVTRDYEVLQFSGHTTEYLHQPPGAPSRDLTVLAVPGLRGRIRAAVHKALRTGRLASLSGGRVDRNGRAVPVRVSVQPTRLAGAEDPLLLVVFDDEEVSAPRAPRARAASLKSDDAVVEQLEQELMSSREELRSTIEELESSNEELKAANEEVMSMNEELQSTNEELETSKEELQSINEELSTVNSQLHEKVVQLEAATNDMNNLLTSADVATLFLDTDLRIRRFTPAVMRLFNLIATDTGRPLSDITARFADARLQQDAAEVLRTLAPCEAEVLSDEGRWFQRRIAPYRTSDNHIGGVVLAFSDIDAVKRAEEVLRRGSARLEERVAERTGELRAKAVQLGELQSVLDAEQSFVAAVLEHTGTMVAVVDADHRIVRANHAFASLAGSAADALAGEPLVERLVAPDQRSACEKWLKRIAHRKAPLAWEQVFKGADGEPRHLQWQGARLPGDDTRPECLVLTGHDVTDQRRVEEDLHQRRVELAHLHRIYTAGELAAALAHELNQPLAAMVAFADAAIRRLRRAPAERRELLPDFEQVAAQAHRAARTVAELRRFLSKGEPSKGVPLDLNEAVRATLELMRIDPRARRVSIETIFGSDLGPVLGDFVHLQHVLTNLIVNALESIAEAPAAGGHIRIVTARDSLSMARVTIADSGAGFGSEAAEKALEMFNTTKRSGLGMGLPISRSIVNAHGGKLWIEPSPEGGRVHFTLRFATPAKRGRKGAAAPK